MKTPKLILPIIVFSQFCCTSLWFAGNAISNDLISHFNLPSTAVGNLTSAVQLGFILGTLLFAILSIADRYSPSKVFFICAVLAAFTNAFILLESNNLLSLLSFRFLTGFFLAGIYPIGMKIASDYYEKGLGKSLGFLVGALVLGTAFPHLLKGFSANLSWELVIISTSCIAILGGSLMYWLVPDGPYRKQQQQFNLSTFYTVFKNKSFRAASFGYFGHMWELYAFWTFVPSILFAYNFMHPTAALNVSGLSFLVIAIGSVACVFSGYVAQKIGTKKTATLALLLSACCCMLSPFIFTFSPLWFIIFLFFWGMVVIADSPLFSTLVAQNVEPNTKGTALTIVNCIGFSITIISIQLLNLIKEHSNATSIYLLLAIGPFFGLIALVKSKAKKPS